MPDLPVYECRRTATAPSLDGTLTDPAWESAAWTTDFVPIADGPAPRFRTRSKLMYDDRYLYVGGELEEPHVWSTMTEHNSRLYFENNFELFLDPDGDGQNYYEFEINPLGTIWELTLPKPYVDGGVPIDPSNLPGLRTAVHVDGTLNDPSDTDTGWTVELAVPWADLAPYNKGRATPPNPGDEWRMNLMRCQWPHEVVDGTYVKGEAIEFWVWSPQGIEDMHQPSTWGVLRF
ncbi:carbohydrate-binding family 9-like protein [Kribbella sp.]|uniref:carbohydrate-binding family 9-like protein n=1 Tax=Kribbella sp. TaxID=1871183 RepID=UPI002D3D5DC8|nr:carbohydrate-binding family 9-like protein [Kribbella sp.]HZX09161.1 carbohydrate-binding family 9-like protein [Kribbella sp.]